MEGDILVRKVTQDVLMFVWFKQEVTTKSPSPELSFVPQITGELVKNLSISVWIDSYENEFRWGKFFKNHLKRMTASPYLFAIYVARACYILEQQYTDAYERFVRTLSLMTHFVLHSWHEESKEFLNTCVDLFCAFFEKEIRSKFEDQGGWENFNEYLVEKQEGLIAYNLCIASGCTVYDLFKEVQTEFQGRTEPHIIGGVAIDNLSEPDVEANDQAVSFAESVVSKMRDLCKQTLEEVLADFAKTDSLVEDLYRERVGLASVEIDGEQPSVQKDQDDFRGKESKVEQSPSQKNKDSRGKEGKKQRFPSQKSEAFQKIKNKLSPSQKSNEGLPDKKGKRKQSSSEKDKALRGKESKEDLSSFQEDQTEALANNPNKTSSKGKGETNPSETLDLDSLKSKDSGPATQESDPSPKLTNAEKAKAILNEMLVDLGKMSELIKYICRPKVESPIEEGTDENSHK